MTCASASGCSTPRSARSSRRGIEYETREEGGQDRRAARAAPAQRVPDERRQHPARRRRAGRAALHRAAGAARRAATASCSPPSSARATTRRRAPPASEQLGPGHAAPAGRRDGPSAFEHQGHCSPLPVPVKCARLAHASRSHRARRRAQADGRRSRRRRRAATTATSSSTTASPATASQAGLMLFQRPSDAENFFLALVEPPKAIAAARDQPARLHLRGRHLRLDARLSAGHRQGAAASA